EYSGIERLVLIDQNADAAVGAERLKNGAREILLPDRTIAGERAAAFHHRVDQRIVERAHQHVHRRGHQGMRERAQLPVSQVSGGEKHATARAQCVLKMLSPFEADPVVKILTANRWELGE